MAWLNFALGLATPAGTIWDESYYLTSTQRYIEGTAQFASHPPLGLMLIAAGERISGANSRLDTHSLALDKKMDGAAIPAGFSFAGVRLAPAIFAVLGAVTFFLLMESLIGRIVPALAFCNLYLFENAFVVQFRAAQLDSFQIAFAILAILFFVKAMKRGLGPSSWLDLGFGVACGLATMVKLNAAVLVVLGPMLVWRRMRLAKGGDGLGCLIRAARDATIMAGGFLAACAVVFTLHVAIGAHPPPPGTPAGAKDARYLTGAYAAYLNAQRVLSPAVVIAAARGYARFMNDDFEGMGRTDPNGSAPLSWPLGVGAINYRWDSDGERTAYVQLAGNPAGWGIGLLSLGLACALVLWPPSGPVCAADLQRRSLMVALLTAYAVFMAAHTHLGQIRVMYLYHYFIGLVLSFTLAPLVFEEILSRWPPAGRQESVLLSGLGAALLAGFLFYAPLSYHRPLSYDQCQARNLVRPVVNCVRPRC